MLVGIVERLERSREAGSALVSVMIVMLVLFIGGMALATVVINTSGILSGMRSTAQSRAAADAGLADAVATSVRDQRVCDEPGDEPLRGDLDGGATFTVTRECDVPAIGQVTFTSTGTSKDDGETVTSAVYSFDREMQPVGDPSLTPVGLVLYEAAEMGQVTLLGTSEVTPQVVVPSGNFLCRVKVPGNVLVGGNITSSDSCDIGGDLWVGGTITFDGGGATIGGDVSAAGSGSSILVAGVGDTSKPLSQLRTNGPLNLKWNGGRVHANVLVNGDVTVNDRTVDGSITVPVGKSVTFGTGGTAAGGVVKAPVPTVPAPELPGWFDYAFNALDWPGYQMVTLRNSSDIARDTCNYYNAYSGWKDEPGWTNGNNRGWFDLADRTTPTIIDARACDQLTSNSGGSPSPALKSNMVFLAKQFNLTGLKLTAAAAADPSVWFITEDTVANGQPNCPVGSGSNFAINGANLAGVKSTIYSPCVVSSYGGGQIRGSLYARGFASGGQLTINGELMGLPNQPDPDGGEETGGAVPTGKQTLGGLVTMSDIGSGAGG